MNLQIFEVKRHKYKMRLGLILYEIKLNDSCCLNTCKIKNKSHIIE
jgi:hypothetical protein